MAGSAEVPLLYLKSTSTNKTQTMVLHLRSLTILNIINFKHRCFVYGNNWYLYPAGNPLYPYDEITNYGIGHLEANVVKYVHNLSSLKQKLKEHKHGSILDAKIDKYFDYAF